MKSVLFALLLAANHASAVNLELAIGQSDFCCTQDGVWWQSPFGFNGQTKGLLSVEVGARQMFGHWGVHGAYIDLGEASGVNLASMRDDEFGKINVSQPCVQSSQRNCFGYFNVHQHVQGAILGGSYSREIHGITVEGEVGQFFYQTDLSISIWCPNCGGNGRYSFGYGGTFNSTSNLRRTPYIAVKLEYKQAFLTWRRFSSVDGNGDSLAGVEAQFATGLTNGPVNQLMIGAKF